MDALNFGPKRRVDGMGGNGWRVSEERTVGVCSRMPFFGRGDVQRGRLWRADGIQLQEFVNFLAVP